jgi:hypothetical protein
VVVRLPLQSPAIQAADIDQDNSHEGPDPERPAPWQASDGGSVMPRTSFAAIAMA